jgi:uncharacterized protein YfaA (DUF2138 family)
VTNGVVLRAAAEAIAIASIKNGSRKVQQAFDLDFPAPQRRRVMSSELVAAGWKLNGRRREPG